MHYLNSIILLFFCSTIFSYSIKKIEYTSKNIRVIRSNENYLVVGTNKGILIKNKKTAKWKIYNKLSKKRIHINKSNYNNCELTDLRINDITFNKNIVWIATDNGISSYNLTNSKWIKIKFKIKAQVISAIEYNDNKLWIGTRRKGVFCYDLNKNKAIELNLNNKFYGTFKLENITYIKKDEFRNCIWIGTYNNGLFCYKNKMFSQFSSKNSFLITNRITSIDVCKNYVCIGTMNGLFLYNNKLLRTITKIKNNLISSKVLSISCYKNIIIVGTSKGFSIIKNLSVKTFYDAKIVMNTEITTVLSEKDIVWIGTRSKGLYKIRL